MRKFTYTVGEEDIEKFVKKYPPVRRFLNRYDVDGTTDHKTVMFSVSISAEGIVSIYVNTWWSGWW